MVMMGSNLPLADIALPGQMNNNIPFLMVAMAPNISAMRERKLMSLSLVWSAWSISTSAKSSLTAARRS
ncbi:hypothetical protein D3C80_2024090 [compost metagenome]